MTRQAIINRTSQIINQLPAEKATEISDFVDFIAKKYEDEVLTQGIKNIVEQNSSFAFLHDDTVMYSLNDLKVKF